MEPAFKDEYKALRDEILATIGRRTALQNVGTAVFTALQGAAVISKTPELSILANILIIGFWNDDNRWVSNITKIGTYIKRVLEPRVHGLQWETIHPTLDGLAREQGFTHFNQVVSRYPATFLVGLLVSILMMLARASIAPPGHTWAQTLALATTVALAVPVFLRASREAELRATWEAIFDRASEDIARAVDVKPPASTP
jgi:hypothetical protein